jgi:exonuclease III
MKIITWNCNGAFRKKYHKLDELYANILIIQECENPAETKDKKFMDWAQNYLWIGDNKNKGIGVFAQTDIILKKLDWTNIYIDHSVKHFLPFSVNNKTEFLAVWTHQNNSPNFGYIGQFWKYIQVNKDKIKNTIIIGDFNSNKIWDEWDRWWNHSDVVKELSEIGLESLYHKHTNEEQGKETQSTFYLQRKKEKAYHIDYCFAPKKHADKLKNLVVEKYEDWNEYSDHNPIIVEFINIELIS